MPSPDPSWTLVTVSWEGVALDGGALVGTLEALPSIGRLKVNGKLVIVNHPFVATIVSNAATLTLPASDDPDVDPTGWTWTITEKIVGRPDTSYVVEVPLSAASTGLDLVRYLPVSESVGMPISIVTRTEVNDLADEVAGKANSASLAPVAFTGSASDITTGTLPSSVLPPLEVGGGNSLVASQAAMLALSSATAGHVAIRTDFTPAKEYFLVTTPASTLSNWVEVNLGGVASVNGHTGSAVTVTRTDVGLGNVDNTSDVNKPISTAAQAALNLKAPLSNPTFTGTVNGVSKDMVGLDQVDNTSDVNKPLSTAATSALNLKAPTASPTFTGTVSGVTKAMVALGNVDNTSDANKPLSTAATNALALKAPTASPTFTGTPSAPPPTTGTGLATRDYVDAVDTSLDTRVSALESALAGAVGTPGPAGLTGAEVISFGPEDDTTPIVTNDVYGPFVASVNYTILSPITAVIRGATGAGDVNFDVEYATSVGGSYTSIFTTGSDKPTVAAGSRTDDSGAPGFTSLPAGYALRSKVLSAPSGTGTFTWRTAAKSGDGATGTVDHLAIPLPTGLAAGDLFLSLDHVNAISSANPNLTYTSGWTQVTPTVVGDSGAGYTFFGYKTASTGETAGTTGTVSTPTTFLGMSLAASAVNFSSITSVLTSVNVTSGQTPTGLTTPSSPTGNYTVVHVAFVRHTNSSSTAGYVGPGTIAWTGSGLTTVSQAATARTATSSPNLAIAVAYETVAANTSITARTASWTVGSGGTGNVGKAVMSSIVLAPSTGTTAKGPEVFVRLRPS